MSILLSRPLGFGWGGKGGWRGWACERKTQDRILDTTLLEGQTQPLESDPDLEALGGEGRGHGVDGRVKKMKDRMIHTTLLENHNMEKQIQTFRLWVGRGKGEWCGLACEYKTGLSILHC